MAPEDVAGPELEVWPDCWPAVGLFLRLATQWRFGFAGPTGLDYGPAFRLMDRMGLDGDEWDDLFEDLRVLEGAALDMLNEKKDGNG